VNHMGDGLGEESMGLDRVRLTQRSLKAAIEFAVYGVPAVLLSRFLLSLTGGALWVPEEWRRVILLLGFLGGLACFGWARATIALRFPPVAKPEAGQRRRKVRKIRTEARSAELQRKVFSQKQALKWLVPTLIAVGLHASLRAAYVVEWTPADPTVEKIFSGIHDHQVVNAQTLERQRDLQAHWDSDAERIKGPAFLRRVNGEYRGSILFPVGFPWSEEGRKFIDNQMAFHSNESDLGPRLLAVEKSVAGLIDVITTAEGLAFGLTQFLFVLAHVLVQLTASVTFGFGFSWAEEITNFLGGLLPH